MTRTFALLVLAVVGCAEPLDEPATGEYWTDAARAAGWRRIDTWGETPGHGNSYRIIYVNELATRFDMRNPAYPTGTVLVKEVYSRRGVTERGSLRVIETMHRRDDGWVFGTADAPEAVAAGELTDKTSFCWPRCHVQAPIDGAWFDYSKHR